MYFFEDLLYEQVQTPIQQNPTTPPVAQQQPQVTTQDQIPFEQKYKEIIPNSDFELDDDEENNTSLGSDENATPVDQTDALFVPIKRYYLIQKLYALNNKLNQLRIKNTILSLVINFIDSFSYESLLSISNKMIEEIYIQVHQLDSNNLERKNTI